MLGPEIRRTIEMFSDVVVDSQGDAETARALTREEASLLARASVHGRIVARVTTSTKVGSPNFLISGLQVSFDGATYAKCGTADQQSVSPTNVGEYLLEILTPIPHGASHIKLSSAVTTLDASNKITFSRVELRVEL